MHYRSLAAALFGIALASAQFRTTVPVVVAPVTVSDAHGKIVNGLAKTSFELLDDGQPRAFELDTSDTVVAPLSVVIVVQANASAPAALLRVRKIGSMVQALVSGARGQAALITFGAQVNTIQDFTADADKISEAFRSIQTERTGEARIIDATLEAARMLAARQGTERRAIVLISEARDRGSEAKVEALLTTMEQQGITVFPVGLSVYVTPFFTKQSELPMPGQPGNLLLLIFEAAHLAKTNLQEALAKYSGGTAYSFKTLRGLEQAITGLGEELHSQYILSFRPGNCAPGFHRIEIRVAARPNARVRARYGYWTEPGACPESP